MKICLNCGKPLINKQEKYCSTECQTLYHRNQYITLWKQGKEPGWTKSSGLSEHIRNYLLDKVGYKCQKCGWSIKHPITGRIPLEIHHVDGDYRNCAEDNLEVLCPNCHSLTPNFGSLNKEGRGEINSRKNYCQDCGKPITVNALRCRECETKHRILPKPATKEELKKLIREKSFVDIGKQYNVTDNAIRKWCASYGLPTRKKDIKEYTDEDWALL